MCACIQELDFNQWKLLGNRRETFPATSLFFARSDATSNLVGSLCGNGHLSVYPVLYSAVMRDECLGILAS